MLKSLVIAALVAAACPSLAEAATGFRQIVVGAETSRPFEAALWYPAEGAGSESTVGETAAFVGITASIDAVPAPGKHPLVLLSHGYRGNWRNLNWLAAELVAAGYAVAAPNHPATMTSDWRPVEAAKLWQRPSDISRLLDALFADASLVGPIDPARIAAAGHSLGGWTVLELAGGRYDPALSAADCDPKAAPVHCHTLAELGIDGQSSVDPQMTSDRRDPRISAFVTLDLGPARGFRPDSLTAIASPLLILAAGTDIPGIDATNRDSAFVAARVPPAIRSYEVIADSTHFSFMQLCKPGAIDRLEADTPGDGMVCRDGGARDRLSLHRQIADRVIGFLGRALPGR